MLLAIDIGNTNVNFALFKNKIIKKKFITPTKEIHKYKTIIKRIFKNKIDNCIICSVAPFQTKILVKEIKKKLLKAPFITGKNCFVPIKNLYQKPKEVGQDRLVNAYAAISLYGAPLIAIDFGTAITFDVISKKKEYLGGAIIPGLNISLETLARNTALLPKIQLNRPKDLIGRNTKDSMLSGIIYGFAALTDDLTLRIKEKIGRDAKVIGTGGNIKLIKKYCRQINKTNPDLTLRGLNMLFSKLESKKNS